MKLNENVIKKIRSKKYYKVTATIFTNGYKGKFERIYYVKAKNNTDLAHKLKRKQEIAHSKYNVLLCICKISKEEYYGKRKTNH